MRLAWQADPTPGVEDGEPASGEIEADSVHEALAELQATYDPTEWALMVSPIHVPPPPGTKMFGG